MLSFSSSSLTPSLLSLGVVQSLHTFTRIKISIPLFSTERIIGVQNGMQLRGCVYGAVQRLGYFSVVVVGAHTASGRDALSAAPLYGPGRGGKVCVAEDATSILKCDSMISWDIAAAPLESISERGAEYAWNERCVGESIEQSTLVALQEFNPLNMLCSLGLLIDRSSRYKPL